jgi:glycerol-3-phosphate acyltransferase PlsY
MISVSVAALLMFIVQGRLIVSVFAALIAALVIYRHRSNIKRLLAGKESKVKWL